MVAPQSRDEAMIRLLREMTKNLKLFVDAKNDYGDLTCNQMLKFCYLEYKFLSVDLYQKEKSFLRSPRWDMNSSLFYKVK